MRAHRTALAVALLAALTVGACSKGDDGEAGRHLSSREQRFADAFAKDLADDDDGFGVDPAGGQCMGEAVMGVLGIAPFDKARLAPKDLAGDDTPGELLGAGAVSDAQAAKIVKAWNGCVDLPKAFAAQGSAGFKLDAEGVACFEGKLRSSQALDRYLEVSFTKATAKATQSVLQDIVKLVQACSSKGGEGGVLVDSIAASLSQAGTIGADEARCMAQSIVDAMGADHLLEVTKSGAFNDAPAPVKAEFEAALRTAAGACGVPASKLGA